MQRILTWVDATRWKEGSSAPSLEECNQAEGDGDFNCACQRRASLRSANECMALRIIHQRAPGAILLSRLASAGLVSPKPDLDC